MFLVTLGHHEIKEALIIESRVSKERKGNTARESNKKGNWNTWSAGFEGGREVSS